MTRLGTEGAFEVLAKARRLEAEGKQIVHLEIGEPDFATPDNIVESGISAMQNGYTHYTPASGIFEAREAVAQFVTRTLKAEVDPNDVVLVPGSKNVLLFTLLACIEPGDEVILPDPGYPAYASQVAFIGGVPKTVTLREETGFELASGGELIALGHYFSSPGFTDEYGYLFLARPVQRSASGDKQDESESILDCREFSVAEIRRMIAENEIRDANTLSIWARLSARALLPGQSS